MSRNSKISMTEILFIINILIFLFYFVKKVIEKGRIIEFLITTPLLILSYALFPVPQLMENVYNNTLPSLVGIYTAPLIIYGIYWLIMLSIEKRINPKSQNCWTNRDWWWTLDGWEFEEEVARVFNLNGYRTKVTKKTGDGGVDIIMYKNNLKYIVQCKHYQSSADVKCVRELNGLKDDFGADILIIVASSGLTSDAKAFLTNKPYFKALTLDDIIRMGLRPSKNDDIKTFSDDVVDVEVIKPKSLPKFSY